MEENLTIIKKLFTVRVMYYDYNSSKAEMKMSVVADDIADLMEIVHNHFKTNDRISDWWVTDIHEEFDDVVCSK